MSKSTTKQWSDVIGHQQIHDWFAAALNQGRFGGSMLFVGASGSGKSTVAKIVSKTLLCETVPARDMAPCGTCSSCIQVEANTHPDVLTVSKPENSAYIPLKALIGPRETRMQEGFCHDIQLKPLMGKRKVAILEDADFLNEEGANCLLKTLEEPPADTLILLIGTVEQQQLPTIRSRCHIIRFSLSHENASRLLREVHRVEASDEEIQEAIETSGGDMHVAQRLLDSEANQFRNALINQIKTKHPDPIKISRLLTKHCDQASKEASNAPRPKDVTKQKWETFSKRRALHDAIVITLHFFRGKVRGDAYTDQVDSLTMARLDRSVRAVRELERNANLATLIDCFAADVAAGTTGERGDVG